MNLGISTHDTHTVDTCEICDMLRRTNYGAADGQALEHRLEDLHTRRQVAPSASQTHHILASLTPTEWCHGFYSETENGPTDAPKSPAGRPTQTIVAPLLANEMACRGAVGSLASVSTPWHPPDVAAFTYTWTARTYEEDRTRSECAKAFDTRIGLIPGV